MNIGIEDVWELYRNLCIGNDRLVNIAWEIAGMDQLIEGYLMEYYNVGADVFYEIKERYSPSEKFNWGMPQDPRGIRVCLYAGL